MIDYQTIERIKSATDIVEVISEFVSLRKAGTNYKALCPFHNERTPSFMVSQTKGIYKCFSCGEAGDAIRFLMNHEQMSYPDALRWLARKYGIEIHEKDITPEERQAHDMRASLFIVNKWAGDYFQHILYETPEGQSVGLAYLRKRGFRDDIIRKFQIGYALPSRDALAKEAVSKGYREEFLLKTGLCKQLENGTLRDKFYDRVIFPVHTLDGRIVAFGARILNTENKNAPKYLNSPESEIYLKRNELYGIYFAKKAIQKNDRCYLVEGYTDVISMHQCGIENVVASSGTSLTYEQIRLIHRFTSHLTVLYDGDSAGIKASLRGINMLLEEGMDIKVLLLPDGDDPDSFARKHNAEEYVQYIEEHQVDFIRFKIDILLKDSNGDPFKQGQVVDDIMESISLIPDTVIRAYYIKECSAQLNVQEQLLIDKSRQIRRKYYEEKRKQREQETARQEAEQARQISQEPVHTQKDEEKWIATPPRKHSMPVLPPKEQRTARFRKEEQLMRAIVRYGEKQMGVDDNGNGLSVIKYLQQELAEQELAFEYPLFDKMMQEAIVHQGDPNFIASKFFVQHPDEQISQMGALLVSEQYQLNSTSLKNHQITDSIENLNHNVPLMVIDLLLAIVNEQIKEIMSKMQSDTEHDEDDNRLMMERYKELKESQQNLQEALRSYN